MSSAAAAAAIVKTGATSTAAVVVRRSRVHSLDGFKRAIHTTARASPPALKAPPSGSLRHTQSAHNLTRGEAQFRVRRRSLASLPLLSRGVTTGAARATRVLGAERTVDTSQCFAEGAINSGSTCGGGFSSAGAAAAATLAVLATASHNNSGENETRGNDKSGWGGGRGSAVWCKDAMTEDASPIQSSRFSVDGTAVAGSNNSSNGFRGHETGHFRTFKEVERMAGTPNGSSVARVTVQAAAVAAAATVQAAAVAAAATAQGTSENGRARITDVYRFESGVEPVGRGNRSTVSSATHRLTGQEVAVKRLSRDGTSRLEVTEEVNMLRLAGAHPNVVTLQAFFEDQDAYYIVMDLCQGGELYHRLADKGRYSEGQAARIMAEVAEAVGFLHRHGIVHFDLKPENIMLAVGDDDRVPEVRLADFGSAFRQHRQICTARDYTIAYSAPEVLNRHAVDEKVDMWAMGVVMWVLLTGRHPFDANIDLSEEEVARRIAEEEPDLRCRGIRHVSPEGKDLVRRLLAKDPEDRPSARQMLAHPWLRAVMTRAKVATRQQRQPRRRRELTEVAWAAAPSAGVATTAAAGGSASVVEGGEGDAMPARRQSPPRATRRPAIGQGRREDGAGVTVAAAQAAASAAVASVTGSDTLPA